MSKATVINERLAFACLDGKLSTIRQIIMNPSAICLVNANRILGLVYEAMETAGHYNDEALTLTLRKVLRTLYCMPAFFNRVDFSGVEDETMLELLTTIRNNLSPASAPCNQRRYVRLQQK